MTIGNKEISGRIAAFYGIAVLLLILSPVLLWTLNVPFASSTTGSRYRVFEYFAFCVSVAAVVIAVLRLRKIVTSGIEAYVPTVIFATLSCYFAAQITEYHPQSSDWLSYERAAQCIVDGRNPYQDTGYLYPPLTAVTLASIFKGISWVEGMAHIAAGRDFEWQSVFYVYQCMQFFLIMAGLALSYRLARSLGATGTVSAVLVALLFVFNVPVMRTLYYHQVNLWLLDLVLLAVLTAESSPMAAGLALAVASHIKLYAAILLVPLMLMKRFRLVAWAAAGVSVIILAQTGWGTNMRLWQDYLAMASGFPAGTTFRDNCIYSIVFNTLGFINTTIMALDAAALSRIVRVLTLAASGIVMSWFGRRFYRRQKAFRKSARGSWEKWNTFYGNMFDALSMALIISPLVWEHHYIIAIPLIIWVVINYGKQEPWRIGIGVFLICAVPVFDIYPFSYNRIAGLSLLLLAATPDLLPPKPAGYGK